MPREIYKNPKERNAKISIGLLGRVVSAETRKKISLANTGRITSPESRLKQSLAHKGKKYFLGKKHSFESIEKMRNAIRPAMTEETKRKMSISRSGERNYFFGKKMSEETKLKISSSKSFAFVDR